MKIWWVCDSKTGYLLVDIAYYGKDGQNRPNNLALREMYHLTILYELRENAKLLLQNNNNKKLALLKQICLVVRNT